MMDRRTLLLGFAMLSACAKKAVGPEKRYALAGDVLGLNADAKVAVIKGDKIEGWMDAMTMDYPVKEKSEFAKLTVGDRINATVFVTDAAFYIGEIKVTGKAGK
jgi:protein SCO1/2